MDFWIDHNCQLLPSATNGIVTAAACIDALTLLRDQHQFSGFRLTATYDLYREPISVFLLRQSKLVKEISEIAPKTLNISFATQARLYEGLSSENGIELLSFPRHGYLPIFLPLSSCEDWIDLEINRLLYQNGFRLLFMNFELYLILYPDQVIEKLLRIPSAAYQFNYKSLCQGHVCKVIKELLQKKVPVLLGTALNQTDKIYFYEQKTYLEAARLTFSPIEYQQLLYWNHHFPDC